MMVGSHAVTAATAAVAAAAIDVLRVCKRRAGACGECTGVAAGEDVKLMDGAGDVDVDVYVDEDAADDV